MFINHKIILSNQKRKMKPLTTVKQLKLQANTLRQDLLEMLLHAGSGHTAGPLGLAEIFTALYFNILKHNPKQPLWENRDRLILSNGHVCPIRYVALAHAGYFPREELFTFRHLGSRLQGHPSRTDLPALELSTASLGQGLGVAVGMSLTAKLKKQYHKIYCITSDGEHDEGNHWEAMLFAAKHRLDNLLVILDRNYIQIDGNTEDVMPLDPLDKKYNAFHWNVKIINGNNMAEIVLALRSAKKNKGKPLMIIANTTPGKGVSYMENDYRWHGSPPGSITTERTPAKEKQTEIALEQLHQKEAKERGNWYHKHKKLKPLHSLDKK